MSLKEKLKDSALGLGGVDLVARDGKALDALKGTVLNTPHSMKGKTPDPSYETEISIKDPRKS